MSETLTPGTAALWECVPRGGYGYSYLVPAQVVSVTSRRVRVRVRRCTGELVERTVTVERLRPLEGTAPEWMCHE